MTTVTPRAFKPAYCLMLSGVGVNVAEHDNRDQKCNKPHAIGKYVRPAVPPTLMESGIRRPVLSKPDCKPGSVQVRSRVYDQAFFPAVRPCAVIHLALPLLEGSSGQPGDCPGACVPLFGLAPDGVYPAPAVTGRAVSSYLAISPLPRNRVAAQSRRYVSVALSVGSPRPAVSGHPAWWCPDFPPSRSEISRPKRRPPVLLATTDGTAQSVRVPPSSALRQEIRAPFPGIGSGR